MPHQHVPIDIKGFARPHLESLQPRTIASYASELAELRDTEARLRKALALDQDLLGQKDRLIHHQEILTQECNHRLFNNLQMIVGLLSLQSRTEANREVGARLSVAASRVASIASLHRHLHSLDGTLTVEFKRYLDELCRDHSTLSKSEEHPDLIITVTGVEVSLPTVTGIPLGLIVNELVTNAIKHGKGRITVKLEPRASNGYALSVCNEGSTLPEGFDPTACNGLGMSLVSALATQIGGALQIDHGDQNDCTRFTVLFS